MARPPRINFPDAVYHVTSRGNGRARIFFDDDDRWRFLRQLRERQDSILPVVDRLLATIRKAESATPETT